MPCSWSTQVEINIETLATVKYVLESVYIIADEIIQQDLDN